MAKKPYIVALIPARGGSKRIPDKNIIPFFGHPMIAYTIAAARNSRLFDRIIVSTDDPRIGQIAQWYGAEYLVRPARLSSDEAGLEDVGFHALQSIDAKDVRIDALCQLMPNCPLRRSEDIVESHHFFDRGGYSFQISVVPYRCVYPHWALLGDNGGEGRWLFGQEYLVRSQQLSESKCPTGAIWWVKVSDFLIQRTFYGNPFYLALMDANRGIDIDSLVDLELADIVVRGLWHRDGVSPLEHIDRNPFPAEDHHEG